MKKNSSHRMLLTVRGYELDSYGHVNNAVYLQYLEQARWEYMRDKGYLDKITRESLFLVVVESNIRYIRESVLFDELAVETDHITKGPFVVFHQKITRVNDDLTISKATVKTVFLDPERTPRDVPDFMRNPE
jgi:YbgC/YbaW family acyl-CoA thioester hydrolase